MKKLILASKSPRRRQLLEEAGFAFSCQASQGEEVFDHSLPVDQALIQVAMAKGIEIFKKHPDAAILCADTIVYDQGKILGKPASKEEAAETLASLSGRWHDVKTAVCLIEEDRLKAETFTTRVHFRTLSEQDIDAYVQSGRCMDKAGSYGIQEVDFCDELDGLKSNVIGLPAEAIASWLEEAGCRDADEDPVC